MTSLEYYIESIDQFISMLTDDIESGESTVVTQTKLAVYREVLEHLEEIEQEPNYNSINSELNGDMISRHAVCEIIDDIRDCVSVNGYWAFLERLKKLPPVNPTKTGHWIDDGFYAEGHSHKAFHCSGCGYNVLGFKEDLSNYCPNCGAKMESEEV